MARRFRSDCRDVAEIDHASGYAGHGVGQLGDEDLVPLHHTTGAGQEVRDRSPDPGAVAQLAQSRFIARNVQELPRLDQRIGLGRTDELVQDSP